MSTVILLDPAELTAHPLLADMPMWLADSDEQTALNADVARRGIDQPLMVCQKSEDETHQTGAGWWLIDGRHRLRGAESAGLPQVPCIERGFDEAPEIILSSLVSRRHYGTKGALAYVSFPICEAAAHAGIVARAENLKVGESRKSTNRLSVKSKGAHALVNDGVTAVAERLGFSRDLYFQAKEVHRLFAQDADYKALCEPQILSGEMGLGGCIAGFAGRRATRGKDKPKVDYFATSRRALVSLGNAFTNWNHISLEQKAEIKTLWDTVSQVLPDDLK